MFALMMSEDRVSMQARRRDIIDGLRNLPSTFVILLFYDYIKYLTDLIHKTLSLNDEIIKLAKTIHLKKSLIVMGRGYNFATCLEAALVSSHPNVFS